jgi:2-amino-4-hydroxy-6-hydroxymethyldihydropteridine diphosphokinase
MVVLGLGSNQGDRLMYLRRALEALKKLNKVEVKQVSGVYRSDALLPKDADSHWNQPYFNLALRAETTLPPHELLDCIKRIESDLERKKEKRWGPRSIDIDILAWDDRVINDDRLCIPHEGILDRPFALWPLADVAPFWA